MKKKTNKNLKRHIKLFLKKKKQEQKSNYLWEMCCKEINILYVLCIYEFVCVSPLSQQKQSTHSRGWGQSEKI